LLNFRGDINDDLMKSNKVFSINFSKNIQITPYLPLFLI